MTKRKKRSGKLAINLKSKSIMSLKRHKIPVAKGITYVNFPISFNREESIFP